MRAVRVSFRWRNRCVAAPAVAGDAQASSIFESQWASYQRIISVL